MVTARPSPTGGPLIPELESGICPGSIVFRKGKNDVKGQGGLKETGKER